MGRENDKDLKQFFLTGFVVIISLVIIVFATRQAYILAHQEAQTAFAAKADLFVDRVKNRITNSLSAAQDIYDFYAVNSSVSEETFRTLVSTNSKLKHHRYFVALAYQVPKGNEAGFEKNMTGFYGEDFRIYGESPKTSEFLYPIIYPWSPNKMLQDKLLGFNLNGNEQISAFLQAASNNQEPSAILLPDFPEIDQGASIPVLLVNPFVSKGGQNAFIVQLLDLPGMAKEVAAAGADPDNQIILQVNSSWFDGIDEQTTLIAGGSTAILDNKGVSYSDRRVSTEITLGAGVWSVQAFSATGSYEPSYYGVVITFFVAVLLSSLLLFVVWSQSERSKRIVEIVNRRTRALKAAHDELEEHYKLLQNLNKDVEEARRAAEMANRAKSEFLATMSHELRTPLNAILGFSQLLEEQAIGPIGDERYIEYAGDIHESGSHLLSLINDILDLAKLESGKVVIERQALSVRLLVDRLLTIQVQQAEVKNISFTAEVSEDMPDSVLGDELRLRQILINLSTNGIKFTQEGSVVVRILPKKFKSGKGGWILEVQDTGIGIPESKQATLFDRFTQVDTALSRRHGGVGLGLAICRELVDRMNGVISVHSTPGVGTTIRVHLPLEEASNHDLDDDSMI